MLSHECLLSNWVTKILNPKEIANQEQEKQDPLLSETIQRLLTLTREEGFIIADPDGVRGINKLGMMVHGLGSYGDAILWGSERQDVIVLSGARGKYQVELINHVVHMAGNVNPTSNLILSITELTDCQIMPGTKKLFEFQVICQTQESNDPLNWGLLRNSHPGIERDDFLNDLLTAQLDQDAIEKLFVQKRETAPSYKIFAWKD